MCGRYALGLDADAVDERLAEYFNEPAGDDDDDGADENGPSGVTVTNEPKSTASSSKAPASPLSWSTESEYRPRFNVAPQSRCLVIRRHDSPSDKSPYVIETMKWGLVPSWMKEPPTKPLNTINARDDKVDSGEGMWKNLRSSNRCVIVAEGFYEWLVKGKDKLPYFTKIKGGSKLMILAGLHDTASFDGGFETLQSFTIITTSSNAQLRFLHTRMPVILSSSAAIKLWLSPTPYGPAIKALLRPYTGELDCYRVAPEVGSVRNDSPEFIKPLFEKKGNIQSMFANIASPTKASTSSPVASTSASASANTTADLSARRVASSPAAAASTPPKKKRVETITLSDSEDDAKPAKKKAKTGSGSPAAADAATTSSKKKAPTKKSSKSKKVEQDGDGNPCVTNYFKSA